MSSRCRFSSASSTVKRGRTPRNSATSPKPGFRSTITRLALGEPRQLDRAVHRDGRRAGAALGAEEDQRHRRRLGRGLRALAARGRAADRALERLFGHRPHEELVGAGAHRLQDQVGLGRLRDGEDRRRRVAWRAAVRSRPGPTARRRGCRRRPDRAPSGRRPGRRSSSRPTGTPPERSSRTDLASELVVLGDDERGKLGHGATPRGEWPWETRRPAPGRRCP